MKTLFFRAAEYQPSSTLSTLINLPITSRKIRSFNPDNHLILFFFKSLIYFISATFADDLPPLILKEMYGVHAPPHIRPVQGNPAKHVQHYLPVFFPMPAFPH